MEPQNIITDNALNFTCVFTVTLKQNKKFPKVNWYFNASGAPWWGRFLERMMRIIRDKLAQCYVSASSVYSSLYQFSEAVAFTQSLLNSRPLTCLMSGDDADRFPICPVIFLNFYSRNNFH